MKYFLTAMLGLFADSSLAVTRTVYLSDASGARIEIAQLQMDAQGGYGVVMSDADFSDRFLSMRPFKCIEGPQKNWCHVPYPYEINRNISGDLVDLECDFLFVWEDANDYGINMWNGVYYKIAPLDGALVGTLHEMDMDTLSTPLPTGELRPVQPKHLHESDPEPLAAAPCD